MDLREYPIDWEETFRTAFPGLMSGQWFAMPGRATEDSPDGHSAVVQSTVKRLVTDPVTGQRSFADHPTHPDAVVHFPGGAGATLTHGIAQGDEGLIVYGSRNIDVWRQSGGTQAPGDDRMSGYQDPHLIPGIRSDPRKLQQVSTEAMHARSDDKRHVHEIHPANGIQTFSADASTPAASASFDPLTMATTFYRHLVQGATGILGLATDGGTTHEHGVTHSDGAFMRAVNSLYQVFAHPVDGAQLNAQNGAHTVTALSTGVFLQSATAIGLDAPSLSLPAGGVSGSALAPGAAASNVGELGGDMSGMLPNPQVTSLANIAGANALPNAANDAAAASEGVAVGGLYRNGSVLMVRVA